MKLIDLQTDVARWVNEAFGEEVAADKVERNHRFLEAALELVQALGCTRMDAHSLVDYVFEVGPRHAGGAGREHVRLH